MDALHGSFLITGIAFLVAALLVAFLFQRQPAPRTSVAPADAQVTTVATNRGRALLGVMLALVARRMGAIRMTGAKNSVAGLWLAMSLSRSLCCS